MTDQPVVDFAGLLRQLRGRAGLTQEELAEAAGLSLRAVSDLERGFHRTARKDTALLLADGLGVAGPARELFVAAARGRAPAADVLAAGGGLPGAGVVAGRQAGMGRPLAASPYLGLRAFGEQDAGLFFGREAATAEVLARISWLAGAAGVLVVSGVSGAGKSSLLRAGVLPQVRAAGLASAPEAASWPCRVFTPTSAPLDELALRIAPLAGADAAALRRGLDADPAGFALTARQGALAQPRSAGDLGGSGERDQPQRRLVLVVDQFEELFTQCADEGQRRAFITALHAAATTGHGSSHAPAALAVLGVRADFEAHCADYPQLADAIQDRYLVTAMTERQLRMAITEPAKKAGSKVDGDLVDVLLGEVRNGQPGIFAAGVLPLLSHALDQAWRSGTGTTVTLADYERTGGIEGAVAASAQRAYDALTPTQKVTARQVFTRLTAISSEGIDSADRATRADLTAGKTPAEAQQVEQVLEAFAAERLLTLAAGTVELSHEILLTAWPLLRDTWLVDTHADRIARTRLRTAATEWDHHTRDPSYLYTGTLLQAATGTIARISADPARHPPLTQTERDFLHASDHGRRRRARRRQALLVFLIALVIGLASVTVVAVRASQQATRERDVALAGQLASESLSLGDTNPAISKLLSIAAWRLNPSSDARYAMLAAAARPGMADLTSGASQLPSLAFSPDSKTIAVNSDGIVRLWDVSTHQPTGVLPGRKSRASSVAFSPVSDTLAVGNSDGTVTLWDPATHQPIGALPGRTGRVSSVAFSPDGKTVAVGNSHGTVTLWDLATHQPIGKITHTALFPGAVTSMAFSPDGSTIAVGNSDVGTAFTLKDMATHQRIAGFQGALGTSFVAFSPVGNTVAVGDSDNGTVTLWDPVTHKAIGKIQNATGFASAVSSVAFSPDAKTLAVGSDDGTIRLWDLTSRSPIGDLRTAAPVLSVDFSPDGKALSSVSADGIVQLWNMTILRPVTSLITGDTGAVTAMAFSPDGKTLATATATSSPLNIDKVRLWNAGTHRQTGILTGDKYFGGTSGNRGAPAQSGVYTGYDTVDSMAFSPDGHTLAIGSSDTVVLWNVGNYRKTADLPGFAGGVGDVHSIAFSPDGKTLAIGGPYGTIHLWYVATHHPTGSFHNTGEFLSLVFSPDGQTLASSTPGGGGSSASDTVRLWDLTTHHLIGNLLTSGMVFSVAVSPNAKTMAIGTEGAIQLWDLATQEQITTLTTGPGMVTSVAFSPNGETLASGGVDGTVRLWDVAYLGNVVQHLCASAGRSMTRAEWTRYVRGPAYEKICP